MKGKAKVVSIEYKKRDKGSTRRNQKMLLQHDLEQSGIIAAMITSRPHHILITGAQGQLGRALSEHFSTLIADRARSSPHLPPVKLTCLGRSELDLTQPDAVRHIIRKEAPTLMINAAAHTAVDQAEVEPDLAHAINAEGPKILAEEARALDATLIHFSTDYVFDGLGVTAYSESDPCHPQSAYGHSKRQGELAILASGVRHLIFRTSWVYAAQGANFMLTMLKLAQSRESLSVIDDQWGAPTWVGRLVAVTDVVSQRLLAEQEPTSNGIYHLCPKGETTWYRYAAKVFELTLDPERKLKTLTPIDSEQYERNVQASSPNRIVARRPRNSRLNCTKLEAALGVSLPAWDDDLQRCVQEHSALRAPLAER
jgi:dTDP-4-dehydrorhamnose reductase